MNDDHMSNVFMGLIYVIFWLTILSSQTNQCESQKNISETLKSINETLNKIEINMDKYHNK